MEQYIDKDAIVAEIEKRITEGEEVVKGVPSSAIFGLIQAYKNTLSFIETLEVKEVDLEKEIQDHIRECLDVKFPTTNIELIKKDVAYTAKKFFELGLKAQKGE